MENNQQPNFDPSNFNKPPTQPTKEYAKPQQSQPQKAQAEYSPQNYVFNCPPQEHAKESAKPGFIMHKVREGDTLLGVSLDYGVSPAAIKKSNGITSDEIFYLSELKIENPTCGFDLAMQTPEEIEKEKLMTIRLAFKNRTGETDPQIIQECLQLGNNNYYDAVEFYEKKKSQFTTQKARLEEVCRKLKKEDRNIETARLYLESHGWDVQAALKGYKEDCEATEGQNATFSKAPGYQPLNKKAKDEDRYIYDMKTKKEK